MSGTSLERWEIEQLLPWRATGTLSRGEAEQIDAALAKDPELMRRYMLVREEALAAVEVNESLGEPSSKAMQRLFKAIDAQSGGASLKLGQYILQFFSGLTARQLALSVCTAAALIVVGGVMGGLLMSAGEKNQVARSGGIEDATTAGYAVVQFADSANIESISALLAANHATIVEGPTPDGSYRVRIAALSNAQTVYRGIENRSAAEQQRDRAVANFRAAIDLVRSAASQP